MDALESGMRALLGSRDRELSAGAEPVGWKIGINVEAVQAKLGISAPVVGYLTSATLAGDGDEVDVGRWTNPMLEPEVAIRIGPDGGVGEVAPAIELVDVDLPFQDLAQILARNVFHRGVLIGAPRSGPAPDQVACRVLRDGETIASAEQRLDGEAVVSHVREFLAAHGGELSAGEWIIAGSLTPPIALTGRELVEVAIDGLGRVAVAIRTGSA